jgi:hypothetical protein
MSQANESRTALDITYRSRQPRFVSLLTESAFIRAYLCNQLSYVQIGEPKRD